LGNPALTLQLNCRHPPSPSPWLLQEEMAKLAEAEGGDEGRARAGLGKLRNVLMQMRKIANHPDLVTAPFTHDLDYPPPETLVEQAGKMGLLQRLLDRLHAGGHKVLIFSQVGGTGGVGGGWGGVGGWWVVWGYSRGMRALHKQGWG
jgi:SNF2 family DNA or RNA helicase